MPSRPCLTTANPGRSVRRSVGSGVGPGTVQPVVQRRTAAMLGKQPVRPLGPCFACGEMGHFRHRCPHKATGPAAVENRKWYPPPIPNSACTCMCISELKVASGPGRADGNQFTPHKISIQVEVLKLML